MLTKYKRKLETAHEDRDYYQLTLYEEKLNNKALEYENLKIKSNKTKARVESKGLSAAFDMAEMRSSQESIARMKKDIKEIEESDAVKEYKFITEQLHSEEPVNN